MRRRLLVAGGLLLALTGAAVSAGGASAYFWDRSHADRLAAGVQIAGVDVGGLRTADARAKLESVLSRQLGQPVRLVYRGQHFVVRPTHAGLRVDVAQMVDAAVRATRSGGLPQRLKLVKTYPIAVGRAGLETPAGFYEINDKQVNPSWHVPLSSWAGDLAGRVIPPGPDDPIKARWLGFFGGAGIHGTAETWSLGSAASHGCIRMTIPDVEQLYDLVPLHTPIYVG